jgi:RNA polymerase sigma-70 factor (ECF subfamily)
MSTLSPTDQEVLRLAAWEELSAPLIAEAMGCSVAAAEQRVHRAKKRLGRAMPSSIDSPVPAPLPIQEGGR